MGDFDFEVPEDPLAASALLFERAERVRTASRQAASRQGTSSSRQTLSRQGLTPSMSTARLERREEGMMEESGYLTRTSLLQRTASAGGLLASSVGVAESAATGLHESESSASFLHSRRRIGSRHLRASYARGEQAFHASDMPEPARTRRREVVAFRQAHLRRQGTERARWDIGTTVAPPDPRRSVLQAFGRATAAYNYRAEVLPRPEPVATDAFGRITGIVARAVAPGREAPNHPALEGKELWAPTYGGVPDAVMEQGLQELTAKSLRATRVAKERLEGHYVGPVERERLRMQELRRRRRAAVERHRMETSEFGVVSAPPAATDASSRLGLELFPPVTPETRGGGAAGYKFLPKDASNASDELTQLQMRGRADIATPDVYRHGERGAPTPQQISAHDFDSRRAPTPSRSHARFQE